jgi:MFS family permease
MAAMAAMATESVVATAADCNAISDGDNFDTLIDDPFHDLPLSAAQWNVHWIFFLRQFWSIAFLYMFAVYGTGDDPKGLGLTAVFSGWLLTASFITPLADVYGRLLLYRCCLGFQLLCLGLICFLPFNIYSFLTLCGLLGVGFGPHSCLQTTIWNEAMPRRLLNVTTNIQFSSWGVIVPVVLYFWKWLRGVLPKTIDPWRAAIASSFILLLAHLASSFLLSPSVPWLISQGKIDAAEKSCTGIYGPAKSTAECDRSKLWQYLRRKEELRADEQQHDGQKVPVRNILNMLFNRKLRWTVMAGIFQFASCGLSYWGQSVQVAKYFPAAKENPELVLSMMAIVEMPASLLAWWLPRKIGFLCALVCMFVSQGVATLCLLGPIGLSFPALFIVRLVSSVLYNQVWMLSTLAFRVEIRGTGSGMLVNMGRAGSLFAPMLGYLPSEQVIWLCASLAFVSAMSCLAYLPNEDLMKNSAEMTMSSKKGPNTQCRRKKEECRVFPESVCRN